MIRTGRENVASREVEEAVYLHPSVAEVAVFGIPHSKWVEAVAAVIVRKPSAQLTADELRRHCAQHLAGFKVPKRFFFFTATLAKNPSRKILKRDLRARYAQPNE
jgi:fatty-acyl-CoA synthase